VLGVGGQRDSEVRPALIKVETGGGRTVLLHGATDFGNAGSASLGQPQLLEVLADAAIARRYGGHGRVSVEVPLLDAGHRPGVADDFDAVRVEVHLGGFDAGFVAAVVGVAQRSNEVLAVSKSKASGCQEPSHLAR